MRRTLCLAALLAPLFAATGHAAHEGFESLVSGTDPSQFALIEIGPETLAIKGDEIRVSGKPNGYFATKKSYRNYVIRFDWRYDRPEGLTDERTFKGNSGLLLHIKAHKVWPECIEVQLMNGDAGNTFGISPAKFDGKTNAAAQKRAIRPVGQWNETEVTCKDGTIVTVMNGVEIARGTHAQPDHGPIGWQSEGSPIYLRHVEIKELD